MEQPAFVIQKTSLTEFVDYPDEIMTHYTTETRTKKETMGLNLEAIIGNFNYIFEYYQNTDFNEGSSSVKSYPNEIGQKTLLGVAFPLSEKFKIWHNTFRRRYYPTLFGFSWLLQLFK